MQDGGGMIAANGDCSGGHSAALETLPEVQLSARSDFAPRLEATLGLGILA
jgi:hypothetical protein